MSNLFQFSTSFRCRLHSETAVASSGQPPHQVLQVRLMYVSHLICRSPAAGLPDRILAETLPSPVVDASFLLPLEKLLGDPLFLEVGVWQLLLSLNLPDNTCRAISPKIASMVVELAGGDIEANLHVVASVDHIQEFLTDWKPGMYSVPVRSGAAISRPKKEKFEEDQLNLGDCSVCLNEMKGGSWSDVIKLRCGHVYHEFCIITWLRMNNSCPLCRTKFE